MVSDAPLDGYLGPLSEEQAAAEQARWEANDIDWGPPEEWEEGRDGWRNGRRRGYEPGRSAGRVR